MEPLAPEDDAVHDLLALIDEVYAPRKSARALDARKRRRHAAARRQALRAHAEELQQTLDAMRSGLHLQGEIDMARLWACVARRQREQYATVALANAQLKLAVRHQRELARCVAALFDEMQSFCVQAKPIMLVSGCALPSAATPALFTRRLDAACALDASRAIDIVRSYAREHHVELREDQKVLHYRFRSRAQYPFKLSSVVDELWRLIHEQVQARPLADNETYCADATFELRKPFGRVEVRGPSVMRRVYRSDGGVLLASVSILKGTESDEHNNLMAGFEMHETMWIRIVRVDASNPKSPVFVESVTESDVVATPGFERKCHIGDSDHYYEQMQLRRLRDYVKAYAMQDPGEGRQQLENRLLDASLLRGGARSQIQ